MKLITINKLVVLGATAIIDIACRQIVSNPDAKPQVVARRINMYTTKPNIGYLYNVGTGRFLGSQSNDVIAVESPNAAIPISITTAYNSNIGTFQSIIAVKNADKPDFGRAAHGDPNYDALRFDVWGGVEHNTIVGLYYTTTTANRVSITLPYYVDDSAFKIKISRWCLGINTNNHLAKVSCVDDDNGIPTDANNRQLFKFCRYNKVAACYGH
ncbi:hypothetical protein NEOKW01_1366 [Nematocida sp. AWRm80]|nr:hypothetical protein NEOKW01_1366 [Nematocida sp. AWRm80]